MFPFVSLLSAILLTFEGRFLFGIITKTREERSLAWSLGLPLGTLVNALMFFTLHLAGISFTAMSVGGVHTAVLSFLFVFYRFFIPSSPALCDGSTGLTMTQRAGRLEEQFDAFRKLPRIISFVCFLFITLTLLSAFIYVTVLPSFYWDTFTHWAMRAKQSFYAGSFITENVVQPQYPILMHSLMMLPAIFAGWSNQFIHLITFLLSLSQLLSIFLIIRKRYGCESGLLLLTLLLSLPIVAIHLRQGYADIHVSFFILLSALFLDAWSEERSPVLLTFSGLLCTAAAWTKFEGLYFGVLPWMGIVGWKMFPNLSALCVMVRRPVPCLHFEAPSEHLSVTQGTGRLEPSQKAGLLGMSRILLTLTLSLAWPLYVLLSGMNPSPHSIEFALNIDTFPMILKSLFVMGSFGLHWWVIVITSTVLIIKRKNILKIATEYPSLIWADIVLILLIGIYLFTNESEGLTVGHNFSRAMILPTLLYTQTLTILYVQKFKSAKDMIGI